MDYRIKRPVRNMRVAILPTYSKKFHDLPGRITGIWQLTDDYIVTVTFDQVVVIDGVTIYRVDRLYSELYEVPEDRTA